jgi:hypothetical protein
MHELVVAQFSELPLHAKSGLVILTVGLVAYSTQSNNVRNVKAIWYFDQR